MIPLKKGSYTRNNLFDSILFYCILILILNVILSCSTSEEDEFTGRLMDIYRKVRSEGIKQVIIIINSLSFS